MADTERPWDVLPRRHIASLLASIRKMMYSVTTPTVAPEPFRRRTPRRQGFAVTYAPVFPVCPGPPATAGNCAPQAHCIWSLP